MAHPTDEEREALVARLEDGRVCSPAQNSCRNGYLMLEAAAMLRACKGRVRVKPAEVEFRVEKVGRKFPWLKSSGKTFIEGRVSGLSAHVTVPDEQVKEVKLRLTADLQRAHEARILSALEPAPDHAEWDAAIEAAIGRARRIGMLSIEDLQTLKKGPPR